MGIVNLLYYVFLITMQDKISFIKIESGKKQRWVMSRRHDCVLNAENVSKIKKLVTKIVTKLTFKIEMTVDVAVKIICFFNI